MKKYNINDFANACLSGGYSQIIAYLENIEDGHELLGKYRDVFEKGTYFIETEDETIRDFLRCYEDCLKWALTNNMSTDEYKEYVLEKFRPFFPDASNWADIQDAVEAYFRDKGYFTSFGITSPYPTLYLWVKENTRKELVELPEGTVEIDVCEMDEVITQGWEDYLSRGVTSAGGWVTSTGTNYFKRSWSIDSDNFKIGLLKHEAQHFFDLQKYPEMDSADLEYRAKLVELIYYKDLGRFFTFLATRSDENDKSNPHAYAEGKIVRELSRRIFGRDSEESRDLWEAESEKIAAISLELLKEDSLKLSQI